MPLVLSLRQGEDFFVGKERIVVEAIHSDTEFTLRRDATGAKHRVNDRRATEIMPDVLVSAGDLHPSSFARIAIQAPKDVLVLRGDKFHNPPDHIRKRMIHG